MEIEIQRQEARQIKYIVVHCTATSHNTKISSIQNYWKTVMKWKSPGYHWIVEAKGNAVRLHPDSKPSNGVAGFNSNSIHICYIGGEKSIDNRTPEQKGKLIYLLKQYKQLYPNAIIQGHRDFPGVKKACPCFDAKKEYKDL